jgi:hypothetical protein
MYARVTMFPGLAPERVKATLAVSASGLDRNRPPAIDRYEMVIQKQPAHA